MEEITGTVFDIARFCLNDGPGIRTTVFLKGCPLHCIWCHNPESQSVNPEIMYIASQCINCGTCTAVCPIHCHTDGEVHLFDRTNCAVCGMCVSACPSGALRLAGKLCRTDEVMHEVRKDRAFYDASGGGMTVSGGEPLMQPEFLKELLTTAKSENIHTCIETSGYAPKKAFKEIIGLTDCFLFDWKETDTYKHISFTGVDNSLIRSNMEYLNAENAKIILRIPFIPKFNDSHEHANGIADISNRLASVAQIEILPYHDLGVSKSAELGKEVAENVLPEVPAKEYVEKFKEYLQKKTGVKVLINI